MTRTSRVATAGFTLWELTMVLLVMAIGAALVAPAFARLGTEQPSTAADKIIGLLRDSRKVALDHDVTSTLRLDPKTLSYRLDTSGVGGTSPFASGVLDMGLTETLASDQSRLNFVFRPTGAAFADTVVVRGGDVPWIVRVDSWSGVARADSR
jgi:prepilin-type N-terminal cleavage/methylation domain-containing protein